MDIEIDDTANATTSYTSGARPVEASSQGFLLSVS